MSESEVEKLKESILRAIKAQENERELARGKWSRDSKLAFLGLAFTVGVVAWNVSVNHGEAIEKNRHRDQEFKQMMSEHVKFKDTIQDIKVDLVKIQSNQDIMLKSINRNHMVGGSYAAP